MAKRLILASSAVLAGLTTAGLLQGPLAAEPPVPRDKFGNIVTATEVKEQPVAAEANSIEYRVETASEAVGTPHFAVEQPGEKRFVREVRVFEKEGVVRSSLEVTNSETLKERYLDLHRRIVERLTPEQLAQKYNALEKELNQIIAEEEIQQIQKQLSELKRKNADHKGISTRVQRAIEALKGTEPESGRREL